MFDLIEKLREKPNNIKKRIAFFTSLSFCSLLFAVWFTVIYPDMKNDNKVSTTVSTTGSSTPVETLSGLIADGISEFKNKMSEVANVFSSFVSTTTVYQATSTEQNTSVITPIIFEESTSTETNLNEEL